MNKPDVGQAFPQVMSLRDYFAANAMRAFLPDYCPDPSQCAIEAYRYADAMIAEREK